MFVLSTRTDKTYDKSLSTEYKFLVAPAITDSGQAFVKFPRIQSTLYRYDSLTQPNSNLGVHLLKPKRSLWPSVFNCTKQFIMFFCAGLYVHRFYRTENRASPLLVLCE